MKLVLQKDQKRGLTGKTSYIMEISAKLEDDEAENIKKYRLGKEVLYSNKQDTSSMSLLGAIASASVSTTITVNDLVNGKHIECKDILEMLAIEEQVKEGAKVLKQMLYAMTTFGGEEVIEI